MERHASLVEMLNACGIPTLEQRLIVLFSWEKPDTTLTTERPHDNTP
jgi:hypothetical protein